MNNIWLLIRSDMKRLFMNVVSCIITIGLIVMPSIFVWYNLIACWNAFDNTGNLKVAVANNDEGYESDLMPIRINVGDMVVSALRENKQIGWSITDEDDAIDGTKSGKYYAAVVIPKEFSRDMMGFYSNDSEVANIVYYVNEKINAISPKITTTGADTLTTEVNTVFAETLSDVAMKIAKSVSDYVDEADIGGTLSALVDRIEGMADDMDRVGSVIGIYNRALESTQGIVDEASSLLQTAEDEVKSLMGVASDGAASVGDAVSGLESAEVKLGQALDDAQTNLEAVKSILDDPSLDAAIGAEAAERIRQGVQNSIDDLAAARTSYNEDLKPSLDRLNGDVETLSNNVSEALSRISSAESDINSVASSISGVLSGASSKISEVTSALSNTSEKMHDLAKSISDAVVSGDIEELRALLKGDIDALSQAIASPVGIDRIAVFPSENFGSAMAPFYTALGIFIGSLLILVVVKPKVSNEAQAALRNPKPRQMLLGRFGCMAFLSLAQTTLMGLGNLFLIQLQAAHPWLLMLSYWVSGLVFTFVIYVLVLSFANLGKALAVILLIIQVTGCGGSYPLQILPDFVQWLSPFLPATHSVNAMRAAMFGVYNGDYWMQMGELLLFLIPAVILGFALRKPFERFMKWYVETVETTHVIG